MVAILEPAADKRRGRSEFVFDVAQDLARCRPTEVDFINGAMVEYGENSAEGQLKARGAGPSRFHEPRLKGR